MSADNRAAWRRQRQQSFDGNHRRATDMPLAIDQWQHCQDEYAGGPTVGHQR